MNVYRTTRFIPFNAPAAQRRLDWASLFTHRQHREGGPSWDRKYVLYYTWSESHQLSLAGTSSWLAKPDLGDRLAESLDSLLASLVEESGLELKVDVLGQLVEHQDSRLSQLEQIIRAQASRLAQLESGSQRSRQHRIDWEAVSGAVQAVFAEAGHEAELVIDREANIVEVVLRDEELESALEEIVHLYTRLAGHLDDETFRSVSIDLVGRSELPS